MVTGMNRPIHPPAIPRATHAADGLLRRAFTLAEVEAMVQVGILSPHERIELVGGEIVPMSPKGVSHEWVRRKLDRHFQRAATDAVEIGPESTLPLDDHSFFEPDLCVFRASVGRAHPTPADVLLVVEIADSALGWDLGRKIEIYAAFAIPEVWVVNARTLVTRVHRGPGETGYGDVREFGPDDPIEPLLVPELAVTLTALGLAPEAGARGEDPPE